MYVSHDETIPKIMAGKQGVQFLCLYVPDKAPEYKQRTAL
jgi:hypothetical protein